MGISLCRTKLNRASPFGFSCRRCIGCCRFKRIQLNPYEIARMARELGLSTTGFISEYTGNGGTVLQTREDGTCVFLHSAGCQIHPARPLVCRLYPLGRYVDYLGVETFAQAELEEGCRGDLHESGTIDRYLEEQGAFPFMHAADLYLNLLWHLLDILKDQGTESSESEKILKKVRAVANGCDEGNELFWVDMDQAVAEYCRQTGITVPDDIEKRMAMHIEAVRKWVR